MTVTIKKRDGRIVLFSPVKIHKSIAKSANAAGIFETKIIEELTNKSIKRISKEFNETIPTVEQIQDLIEKELINSKQAEIAKSYIIYRNKRDEARNAKVFIQKAGSIIDSYLFQADWRVRENANVGFSISGLQQHIAGGVIAEYTLNSVYPTEVAVAHRNGDFHIHDLAYGTLAGYCAGWSLKQLLIKGFNGVKGKIEAGPAKHLDSALGQMVNFLGTLQNEWAGAQAFSSFDTYLAPFVRYDEMNYEQVKQSIQEFVYSINQTSRWGNQSPFTNITFDWKVPEDMKKQHAIHGGKLLDETYEDFQTEMDMINKAFIEVMMKGDMKGRIFTFPIPTYNITRDFDWDSENSKLLFEMTAKYGIPYFQNFVNSSLSPSDVRSMCCRLQLDVRSLIKKTGGIFGNGESTGSVGVVTINLPRIGYLAKSEQEYFSKLKKLIHLGKISLEIKRKNVDKSLDSGLLPWSKEYLGNLDNHFSTIGICGMHESCLNFLGKGIETKEGRDFAIKVLDYMREELKNIQSETGHLYNLEATPAEGTAYRFAKHDKSKYPDIISSGEFVPYYTNSTQLPVGFTEDVFEALAHQDELQTRYTGGTVLHGFIGEKIDDWKTVRELVMKVTSNFRLPYFSVTPTFSICPIHGYIGGRHDCCPMEHTEEEIAMFGIEE